MLSGNCTEALSIQANVTISGSSTKLIKNGIAPLPFPPRAATAMLVHKARGEGHLPAATAAAQAGGEGTCSILCNVRVNSGRMTDASLKPAPLKLLSVVIPARDEAGCICSTVEHLHV